MTDEEYDRLYPHIRRLYDKIDDDDPCSILHIDPRQNPVRVVVKCDGESYIEMLVKVVKEARNAQ